MLRWFFVSAFILMSTPAVAQTSACHDAEVAFVGRAEPAVTFHISGEATIERARQNVIRLEKEAAAKRAAMDPRTRLEHDLEFELRLMKARDELDFQRTMHPPPQDLTFMPFRVEHAFRGVTESTVMVLEHDVVPRRLEPDQTYLVIGLRSTEGLIPLFYDGPDLSYLNNHVEAMRISPVAVSQSEVEFLRATSSGATVLGTLHRHGWGDGLTQPIGGVPVVVSSGGRSVETTTRQDGSFALFGVPPGRLQIKLGLPDHLTVFNKSELTIDVRDGACRQISLTAEVNGRVRGRILTASSRPPDGARVSLYAIDPAEFLSNPTEEHITGPTAPSREQWMANRRRSPRFTRELRIDRLPFQSPSNTRPSMTGSIFW